MSIRALPLLLAISASLAVSAVSFIIVSLMGQAAAPVHGDSSSRSTP